MLMLKLFESLYFFHIWTISPSLVIFEYNYKFNCSKDRHLIDTHILTILAMLKEYCTNQSIILKSFCKCFP